MRIRTAVALVEGLLGQPYTWSEEAAATADSLDFVARVEDLLRASRPPLLIVSGEQDHPAVRADAADLAQALRQRYPDPDDVQLQVVPGLGHPLAEEPGLQPSPQLPAAAAVDHALDAWFRRYLQRDELPGARAT